MKDELMHFLENHSLFRSQLDVESKQMVRDTLDDFFILHKISKLTAYQCEKCGNTQKTGYVWPIQQIQARCF